ncbi:hypothetical protein MMM100_08380 [Helicobacter pylori]
MDNIWFQYKIGKQLDELEIEDSLCLSLFKSLEMKIVLSLKNLAILD